MAATEIRIDTPHRRRLREIWRSAGWPCQDMLELELLAAGLLERLRDADGRDTLRVTDAGVQLLVSTLQKNRAARDGHEQLVERVAAQMQRQGRVVWRALSLRAPLPGDAGATTWAIAMPDVYSIRHTTVEDYEEPVAHDLRLLLEPVTAERALRRKAVIITAKGVAHQWQKEPSRRLRLPHVGQFMNEEALAGERLAGEILRPTAADGMEMHIAHRRHRHAARVKGPEFAVN